MTYKPRHRRCTRPKHHVWLAGYPLSSGWTLFQCINCGATEI